MIIISYFSYCPVFCYAPFHRLVFMPPAAARRKLQLSQCKAKLIIVLVNTRQPEGRCTRPRYLGRVSPSRVFGIAVGTAGKGITIGNILLVRRDKTFSLSAGPKERAKYIKPASSGQKTPSPAVMPRPNRSYY